MPQMCDYSTNKKRTMRKGEAGGKAVFEQRPPIRTRSQRRASRERNDVHALLVVGDVAGRSVIVAGVVRVAVDDARVATVVATAVATRKAPDVLHASSRLTPSAWGTWLVKRREVTRCSPLSCLPQGAAHASLPSWRPRWRRARLPTCCTRRHG